MRARVIAQVESGASRREAAEEFAVSASTAIIWVKCFRETGRCAAKPRGGSVSPLEQHADFLSGLIEKQPDLTLDEVVLAMRKHEIAAAARCGASSSVTISLSKKKPAGGGAGARRRGAGTPTLGPHQDPEDDQRYCRDRELEHAARAARFAVASKDQQPRARIRRAVNIQLSFVHPEAPIGRRPADRRMEVPRPRTGAPGVGQASLGLRALSLSKAAASRARGYSALSYKLRISLRLYLTSATSRQVPTRSCGGSSSIAKRMASAARANRRYPSGWRRLFQPLTENNSASVL
jgi:transposase